MCKFCLYFDLDVPFRLNKYRHFDIGKNSNYFNSSETKNLLKKLSKESYLPLNEAILNLIKKYDGKFKVTFSVTGFAFELFEKYSPELVESFKELFKTKAIEFVLRPYHNLFVYSENEYNEGLLRQKKHFKKLFGVEPKVSSEPEVDDLAKKLNEKGNIDFYYNVQTFADEINFNYGSDDIFNLKFDYDNFKVDGCGGKSDSFNFLESFPDEVLKNSENSFELIGDLSENSERFRNNYVRNLEMNSNIEKEIYGRMKSFETLVLSSGNLELIEAWRQLNNLTNFYHLKHHDSNPYGNGYETYIYFMNILSDMKNNLGST